MVGYLRTAGVTVLMVQPRQVKAYAWLHLRRAKNDRLDAMDHPQIVIPAPGWPALAGRSGGDPGIHVDGRDKPGHDEL